MGKQMDESSGMLQQHGRCCEVTIKDSTQRATCVVNMLVGYSVRTELIDRSVYEGVFHSVAFHGNASVVLKVARIMAPASEQPAVETKSHQGELPPGWFELLEIPLDDLVCLKVLNVRMHDADVDSSGGSELPGFGTDSSISRSRGCDYGRERVLQKWTPAADDSTLESIEDSTISGGGGGGRWDQFAAAANQISQATAKPSFHEDFYTTPLDMSNSRISPAAALRVAKQIEADNRNGAFGFGGSGNTHLDEERGFARADDLDMDEEEKYSSVQRTASQASGVEGRTSPVLGSTSAPRSLPVPIAGRSAWSNAGSSIAAISGRTNASPMSSSLPRPIPGRTASGDNSTSVNARREHNRVAIQMGTPGSRKDRVGSSPYGTPNFSRSPLSSSPLVRDAAAMEALNLDAGSGRKLGKDQEMAFREFKAKQTAEKAQKELEDTKRRVLSYKTRQSVDGAAPSIDFSVSDNNSPLDGSMMLSDTALALSASPPTSITSMPPLPARLPLSVNKSDKAASTAEGSPGPSTPSGQGGTQIAVKKLNPNAKTFSFNPSATSFTPGTARSISGSISGSNVPAAKTPTSARRQQFTEAPSVSSALSSGGAGVLREPARSNSMSRRHSGGQQSHPEGPRLNDRYGRHGPRPPPGPPPPQGPPALSGTPPRQQHQGPQGRSPTSGHHQGERTSPRSSMHHAASPGRQLPQHGHNRNVSGGSMTFSPFGASPVGPFHHDHVGHMGGGPQPPMCHPPQSPGSMGGPPPLPQRMHSHRGGPPDGRNTYRPHPAGPHPGGGMSGGHPPMGGMVATHLVHGPPMMAAQPQQPAYGMPYPPMPAPGSPHNMGGYHHGGFEGQSPPMRPLHDGGSFQGGARSSPYGPGGGPPQEPPLPGMHPQMYPPPSYATNGGRPMGPMPPHNGFPGPSRPSLPHNGPPQYWPGGQSLHNGPGGTMRPTGPPQVAPYQMGPGGGAMGGGPPQGPPQYQQWNGHPPPPQMHHSNNFHGARPPSGPPPPPGAREHQRPTHVSGPSGPRRT